MNPTCPECGRRAPSPHGYPKVAHTQKCSRATVDDLRYYADTWKDTSGHRADRLVYFVNEHRKWQGKNAILRHENNKLRARVSKQDRLAAALRAAKSCAEAEKWNEYTDGDGGFRAAYEKICAALKEAEGKP